MKTNIGPIGIVNRKKLKKLVLTNGNGEALGFKIFMFTFIGSNRCDFTKGM